MHYVKKAAIWLAIALVVVVIEKKTGAFTWIFTLGGRFKNPLVS